MRGVAGAHRAPRGVGGVHGFEERAALLGGGAQGGGFRLAEELLEREEVRSLHGVGQVEIVVVLLLAVVLEVVALAAVGLGMQTGGWIDG